MPTICNREVPSCLIIGVIIVLFYLAYKGYCKFTTKSGDDSDDDGDDGEGLLSKGDKKKKDCKKGLKGDKNRDIDYDKVQRFCDEIMRQQI